MILDTKIFRMEVLIVIKKQCAIKINTNQK
jgi:hypothetical protein